MYEGETPQQIPEEIMEPDVIEMTDDEGNTILLQILDYFFYNGEEYAILTDSIDGDAEPDEQCAPEDETDEAEGIACYVMKVNTLTDENGEELEEFIPVEDQALEAKLMEVASTRLNDDDELDED
ncbi:MAG: DUF1292 domain-containing protein [Aristaeellaceae bacterium]